MGNKRYSERFKQEAVNLVEEIGYSVEEAANRLRIATELLTAWRESYGQGSSNKIETEEQIEIRRLQTELQRITEERDFLIKDTTYFKKHTE